MQRRMSPSAKPSSETDYSDSPLLRGPQRTPSRPPLLESEDVPSWYAHNAYIRTGYRPVTFSARLCFHSLAYIHNETANIYSHLIPAVAALLSNGLLYFYFSSAFPRASWSDQLVFHIYLTTSMMCFGISSTYHTLLCHSAHFADLWGRLDYVAIVLQILGSFISGIYIGFYCEPHLQKLYWSMVRANVWLAMRWSPNCFTDLHSRPPDWICCRASSLAKQRVEDPATVDFRGNRILSICTYTACLSSLPV